MSKFKILWIDDQPIKCTRTKRSIHKFLEKLNFEPDILMPSPEDISKDSLSSPDGNLHKALCARDIDLLIVDYNLSDNLFGGEVIAKIRESNDVYCDIVYYSSDKDDLIGSIKKSYDDPLPQNYFDGIYAVPFDEDIFVEKIERLIRNIIHSWYNIHSIRGVILSKASKFESMAKQIVEHEYISCLPTIKDELEKKKCNVLSNHEECWRKMSEVEDPVPMVLHDPVHFNWAVQKKLLRVLYEAKIIGFSKWTELDNVFKLRNDFAHNPLHLVEGHIELTTPDGKQVFSESDIETIRALLFCVETDLSKCIDAMQENGCDAEVQDVVETNFLTTTM